MNKKPYILFACAIFAFVATADEQDDPEYAYVDVPYTCNVDKSTKAVTVSFANGSIRNFYYCNFTDQHKKVTEAMEEYGDAYDEVQTTMSNNGISEKFYAANMDVWNQVVTAILYDGQARQQVLDNELQAELAEQLENGIISQAYYEEKYTESIERIETLKSYYEANSAGVTIQMSKSIQSLESQISSLKQQQKLSAQNLKNELAKKSSAMVSEIKDLLTSLNDISLNYRAALKTINMLKTTVESKTIPIIPMGDVSSKSHSNSVKRLNKWLGGTNNVSSVFFSPRRPFSNERYTNRAANIASWMADLGVVGYLDREKSRKVDYVEEELDSPSVFNLYLDEATNFYREGVFLYKEKHDPIKESTVLGTNVFATFDAPFNWADRISIDTDDDGHYYVASVRTGCFGINSISTNGVLSLANPYYMVGGRLYYGPATYTLSNEPGTEKILAIKISTTAANTVTLEKYNSISDLQEAQDDVSYYTIPLYLFDGYRIKCDFRVMPCASMGEF